MARASLPGGSYSRPQTVFDTGDKHIVRFMPEDGGAYKDFEFRRLGLAPEIESALVAGFARACGPGGTRKTVESVKTLFAGVRVFASQLDEFPSRPQSLAELAPAHIAPLRLRHSRYTNSLLQVLRVLFRQVEGLPAPFREALYAPQGKALRTAAVAAYTDAEARLYQRAARTEVRAALARMRGAEAELTAWEAGLTNSDPEAQRRGKLLAHVARTGDVPRGKRGQPDESAKHRGASELLRGILPSGSEVTALAVLLLCVTGHNLSTVWRMKASHTRADDQMEEEPVVLTRASKPRRGRYDAEMDIAMTPGGVPPAGPDDYASSAGVYRIALELCARARNLAGTDALLVFHGVTPANRIPGGPKLRPLPTNALEGWRPRLPDGSVLPRLDSRRLRLAFVQRHQRPIAHSAATLATGYLAKNLTALPEYQAIVSDVLDAEVDRVSVSHSVLTLTEDEVRSAAVDPDSFARLLGTSVEQLRLLLEGRLDTVAAACVDNVNSPHDKAGTPCTASFLLCLGCPNARSEPRHVPIQALVLQSIQRRRTEISAEEWEERYGRAHEQLVDLLMRQRADPNAAANNTTDEDRRLVELLLDGGLDLR